MSLLIYFPQTYQPEWEQGRYMLQSEQTDAIFHFTARFMIIKLLK